MNQPGNFSESLWTLHELTSINILFIKLWILTQTSKDLNLTSSVLTYHPKIEDQGKFLSCRAENPLIPDSGVEKGFKLNLHRKFLNHFSLKAFPIDFWKKSKLLYLNSSGKFLFSSPNLNHSTSNRSAPHNARVWHKSGGGGECSKWRSGCLLRM